MERTLYILFLRYPEGINADELWRYWDEQYIIRRGKDGIYRIDAKLIV
jgi:hypothetical protein